MTEKHDSILLQWVWDTHCTEKLNHISWSNQNCCMDFEIPIDFFKVRYVKGWLMAVTSSFFRRLDRKLIFSPHTLAVNSWLLHTSACSIVMCTVLWYWSKIKSCGTTQWRDDIILETQKNTLASWKYKDDTRDFCFLLFLLIFFFFIDRCFLFCT